MNRWLKCIAVWGLCLSMFGVGRADATLTLSLSVTGATGGGGTFRPGNTQSVSLSLASNAAGSVDIFLGVMLPDGSIYWLTPANAFAPVSEPIAFFDNAPLESFGTRAVIDVPFGTFIDGAFMWGAIAVPDGQAPLTGQVLAMDLKSWSFSNTPVAKAVVTTVAADYSSSAVTILDDAMGAHKNTVALQDSNYVVKTFGDSFYLIGRSGIDTVTRIPFATPTLDAKYYQYSGMDASDGSTSPSCDDIVFVSETKAYLIRMKSSRIWIINPSATSEATFHTGDIDLSGFTLAADPDGCPDPTISKLVNGKLYVLLQNTNTKTWTTIAPSSIAVIDTATDTLVDTDGDSANGVTPIALHYWSAITMQEKGGYLWVAMPADMFGYSANPTGIDRVSTADYSVTSIINGGTSAGGETQGGTINDLAMVSATHGFFNAYRYDMSKYQSIVSVREFTIATDGAVTVLGPVAALANSVDNNALAAAPDGTLWVLDKTGDGGVIVYHPDTGIADAAVNVGMLPSKVAFHE